MTADDEKALGVLRQAAIKAHAAAKKKSEEAKQAKESADDADKAFLRAFDKMTETLPLFDAPDMGSEQIASISAEAFKRAITPERPRVPDFDVNAPYPADHDPNDWRCAPVTVLRTWLTSTMIGRLQEYGIEHLRDLENAINNRTLLGMKSFGKAKILKIEEAFISFVESHINAAASAGDPQLATDASEQPAEGMEDVYEA